MDEGELNFAEFFAKLFVQGLHRPLTLAEDDGLKPSLPLVDNRE